MGGDTTTAAAPPPPVDYSAMMAYSSDNNKTIAMGQIMAQQFAMQQASADRQMQTMANLELGIEKLDTKLQIAKLNYIQSMTEEEDRHVEKMAEIGGDIDAARAEQEASNKASNAVDLTNFLSDGEGGYAPQGASGFDKNSGGIDFNEQWNQLLQNEKDAQAGKKDSLDKGVQANKDAQDNYQEKNSPYGDADGDGTANIDDGTALLPAPGGLVPVDK